MADTSEKRKGTALIKALLQKADRLGMDRYQLASELDITYSYLTLMLNGTRQISNLGEEKLRRMAAFLEVPYLQVVMMAELVTPSDTVMGAEEYVDQMFHMVYESMSRNPRWKGYCLDESEWHSLSDKAKVFFSLLYQTQTDEQLLEIARAIEVRDPEDDLNDHDEPQRAAL